MSIKTYPEMNETIKNLLRMSQDDPMKAYTLARIEELEKENEQLKIEVKASDELIDQKQNTINHLLEQLNA